MAGDVPATGVLCFVEADWPLVGGAFTIQGTHVVWPKRLAKLLAAQRQGGLDVAALRATIAASFPAA
ncbi:MAG: hypothetical protein L0H79_21270 [Intrasporangium sp.]|uniref:hypothetical protein n=1 Tax=Intrasporangium sp. TaxID=1925024 RepID=UPI002649E114|nr:hypothetical protein [Intrasporangium sp.]MDN5798259.1 hypothetical protein [Intrasporangium sp.]